MDRRAFFKHFGRRVSEKAIEHMDQRVEKKASHWIRPPYAIAELEFLLACTRCDKCIEACPHEVVFPLPARRGGDVVHTPAMDLLNHGCHLCSDWPCVSVCASQALKLPLSENNERNALPKLAIAVIETGTCLPYQGPDCGACETSCPVPGALEWHDFKPYINIGLCTGCALCREACVLEDKAIRIHSLNHIQRESQT
mgnify:CR=1 FL=1